MRVLLRVLPGVLCLGSMAMADAPLVYCKGAVCGEGGPRAYAYHVDSPGYPMMEFEVGTNYLKPEHYNNVLSPPGWRFTVEDKGMSHDHGGFTSHGRVSPGPCKCLTAGRVHWWTKDPQYAIESFTFGFDLRWNPEDLGWSLLTRREGPPPKFDTFTQSWDAAVGMGKGPLHGPSVPASANETIKKAKCKVKNGAVKKATVNVKNARPGEQYTCTLDTQQEITKKAKPSGKIRFKFAGDDAPPCGHNGATVRERYKSFDCSC